MLYLFVFRKRSHFRVSSFLKSYHICRNKNYLYFNTAYAYCSQNFKIVPEADKNSMSYNLPKDPIQTTMSNVKGAKDTNNESEERSEEGNLKGNISNLPDQMKTGQSLSESLQENQTSGQSDQKFMLNILKQDSRNLVPLKYALPNEQGQCQSDVRLNALPSSFTASCLDLRYSSPIAKVLRESELLSKKNQQDLFHQSKSVDPLAWSHQNPALTSDSISSLQNEDNQVNDPSKTQIEEKSQSLPETNTKENVKSLFTVKNLHQNLTNKNNQNGNIQCSPSQIHFSDLTARTLISSSKEKAAATRTLKKLMANLKEAEEQAEAKSKDETFEHKSSAELPTLLSAKRYKSPLTESLRVLMKRSQESREQFDMKPTVEGIKQEENFESENETSLDFTSKSLVNLMNGLQKANEQGFSERGQLKSSVLKTLSMPNEKDRRDALNKSFSRQLYSQQPSPEEYNQDTKNLSIFRARSPEVTKRGSISTEKIFSSDQSEQTCLNAVKIEENLENDFPHSKIIKGKGNFLRTFSRLRPSDANSLQNNLSILHSHRKRPKPKITPSFVHSRFLKKIQDIRAKFSEEGRKRLKQ